MEETIDGSFVHGDDVYIDEHYMGEQWAYISGAPGYKVSDKGRVWSEHSQRFLKNKPMDAGGHLGVCIHVGGKCLYRYIHRLVAEAFNPNPHHLPVVRHLYDDPTCNCKEDLAWGTQRDNMYDAIRNGRAYALTDSDREKGFEMSRTPLKAINLHTGKTLIFRGQGEAGRALGIPQANIWKVLNGQRKHAKDYDFEYIRRDDVE